MWSLLRLHDTESTELVRDIAVRWGPNDGRGRIARIVAEALRGNNSWIVDRLLRHEHDETAWLAHTARLTARPELIAAVRRYATEAPDDECREACRRELEGEPRVGGHWGSVG